MQRLVIALTALLGLTAAAVVAGYLFLFSSAPDRAAVLAPGDTVVYVNVYLQPSTGQRLAFQDLATRFPGYGDPATLDAKIEETIQRYLAETGLDYGSDIRPWLGSQLAVALSPRDSSLDDPALLAIAHASDPAVAEDAIPRLAESRGDRLDEDQHAGVRLWIGESAVWAVIDDMVVMGDSEERVRAAIDAQRGAVPSLAGDPAFVAAMRDLPPDHLATAYVDLTRLVSAEQESEDLAGYSTLAMALIAERDGLRMVGHAPFDDGTAGAAARASFAMGTEPATLTEWMPAETRVAVVVFGVAQMLQIAEEELAAQDDVALAIGQLRAIVALGLGISVDNDLLPLLDREVALALTDVEADPPGAVLLLRPRDAQELVGALDRIREALAARGASVNSTEEAGVTITSVTMPEVGEVSWAVSEGVALVALDLEPIVAALEAHASGRSLATAPAYRSALALAGDHAGNEIFVDGSGLADLVATEAGLPADARAMLEPIRAIAVTMPARDDRLEFHVVIPIE